MKTVLFVVGILTLTLAESARADDRDSDVSSTTGQPYAVSVFGATIMPWKADGAVWDGTRVLRDLPTTVGLSPEALAAAAMKKVGEAGLRAIQAPDVYVTVAVNGERFQTPVVKDSYQPSWNDRHTFQLRAGDVIELRIFDQDLQQSTVDPVGSTLHRLTQAELDSGVVEIVQFGQVIALQIKLNKLATKEMLYAPGRYLVTIVGASIRGKKPSGDRDAGKDWDPLSGSPDVFGTVKVGSTSFDLELQGDTLTPVWNVARELDLDENTSLQIDLKDKDLRTHDAIGTLSIDQLLTVAPDSNDVIHLSDGAAIIDLRVTLQPVAKPLTVRECREIFARLADLAARATPPDESTNYRHADEKMLRACVAGFERKAYECVTKAADLNAAASCVATRPGQPPRSR